jgi:N-acetyltransferase 10
MSKEDLERSFNNYDVKRLEMYAQNLVDYHLIIDLVPEMAKLYFTNKLGEDINLSLVQSVIYTYIFFCNTSIVNGLNFKLSFFI